MRVFGVIVAFAVAVTSILCQQARAKDLASMEFTTDCLSVNWRNYSAFSATSFQLIWRIKQSYLIWYNISSDRDGETMALNSETSPTFEGFIPLITDGIDLEIDELYLRKEDRNGETPSGIYLVGKPTFESDLLGNQLGSTNGIDLEGNRIEAVSLTIEHETRFMQECSNRNVPVYELTITITGRQLMRHEDALAVIANDRVFAWPCHEPLFFSLHVTEELSWSEIDFVLDNSTSVQTGDTLFPIQQFGTHPMEQLLTNGVDGSLSFNWEAAGSGGGDSSKQSVMLKEQPGF